MYVCIYIYVCVCVCVCVCACVYFKNLRINTTAFPISPLSTGQYFHAHSCYTFHLFHTVPLLRHFVPQGFTVDGSEYFFLNYSISIYIYIYICGFGGLGVACWPLVPKFAGSNPAEAVGFLRAEKSSARLPSEGK